jgi:hypothetical protein
VLSSDVVALDAYTGQRVTVYGTLAPEYDHARSRRTTPRRHCWVEPTALSLVDNIYEHAGRLRGSGILRRNLIPRFAASPKLSGRLLRRECVRGPRQLSAAVRKEALVQTTTAVQRSSEEVSTVGSKIGALLVALLAVTVLLTGCGGGEEAQDDGSEEQDTSGQTTEQTANTDEKTEATTNGEATMGGRGSGREITLSIEGDPGTEFSGTCTVGEEANEFSGQVPESFGYDLEGQQLECEIRQEDAGSLEILLTGPGDRIEQQINNPGGTISLTYSENGVSSSTSSSGSSSSVSQVVSNSSGGSSSSSSVSSG